MATIILLISLLTCLPNQESESTRRAKESAAPRVDGVPFECSQPAAEQGPLIREAVENQYWVRRVEFVGNEYTRDNLLRRRILLQEGDVFTREGLVSSLGSVNRLKGIIYPVRLSDVILSLDRPGKIVDMTICFRERRRPRQRIKRTPGKRAS